MNELLLAMRNGDAAAVEQLMPIVYGELRRVAGAAMARVAHIASRHRYSRSRAGFPARKNSRAGGEPRGILLGLNARVCKRRDEGRR